MISEDMARELPGKPLFGNDGGRIGTIGQVFVDRETGQPEWVTIQTGPMGSPERFVPLVLAEPRDGGVVVPLSKSAVDEAPSLVAGPAGLAVEAEARLYEYYGIHYGQAQSSSGLPSGPARGTRTPDRSEGPQQRGPEQRSGERRVRTDDTVRRSGGG